MAGLAVIYIANVSYLFLINNLYLGKNFSLWMAVYYGFILCIGGDVVSSYLGSYFCVRD